jgi:hypothetical protein
MWCACNFVFRLWPHPRAGEVAAPAWRNNFFSYLFRGCHQMRVQATLTPMHLRVQESNPFLGLRLAFVQHLMWWLCFQDKLLSLSSFLDEKVAGMCDNNVYICVCVSALKHLTYFHEIWYLVYAIWGRPQIHTSSFLPISNNNMGDALTCEVGATLAQIHIEPWNIVW